MAKKKDSSAESGTTISGLDSGQTANPPTMETASSETTNPSRDASQKPSEPPKPPPLPQLPNPIKKRRGRPPGSKTQAKSQPSPAQEPVTLVIPREALVSIAKTYSGVLCAFDLGPALARDEVDAIAESLDACAKKYGGDFEHWPLVALATAVITPLGVRIMAKRKEAAESKTAAPDIIPPAASEEKPAMGSPLDGFKGPAL